MKTSFSWLLSILGESCSGKTECFKNIINFLIRTQTLGGIDGHFAPTSSSYCCSSLHKNWHTASMHCNATRHGKHAPSCYMTASPAPVNKQVMICKSVQCDIMRKSPQLSPISRFQRANKSVGERGGGVEYGYFTPNVRRSQRTSGVNSVSNLLPQKCANCQFQVSVASKSTLHKSTNDLNFNLQQHQYPHHNLGDNNYGINYDYNSVTLRSTCSHTKKNRSTGNLLNYWNRECLPRQQQQQQHQYSLHGILTSYTSRPNLRSTRTHSLEKENDQDIFYSTAKCHGQNNMKQSRIACYCGDRPPLPLSHQFKRQPRHFSELHLANNNNAEEADNQDECEEHHCHCQCNKANLKPGNDPAPFNAATLAALKMGECLWYADLLLGAMGNAFTTGNSNASRFVSNEKIKNWLKIIIIGVFRVNYLILKSISRAISSVCRSHLVSSTIFDWNIHKFLYTFVNNSLVIMNAFARSLKRYVGKGW